MGILCIDAGGSFLKHTVLDEDLDVTEVSSVATPRDNLDSFLHVIRSVYEMYQGISGIAISIPGIIDVDRGFMYTGGSLDYIRDIPMKERISELCDGLPVSIENDGAVRGCFERGKERYYPDPWHRSGRNGDCRQKNPAGNESLCR